MILAIKLLYKKFNIINELSKIIHDLQKDNSAMEEEIIKFRTRAIEAEIEVEKLTQQLRNARLVPQPIS